MAKSPRQRTIATLGEHGQTVRVYKQGDSIRVSCRALSLYRTFRGEGAKDRALGFAAGLAREGQPAKRDLTVGELWAAYKESADYRELRPRSQALYSEAWRYITEVVPSGVKADDVTVLTLEKVRTALETVPRETNRGRPLAINTIRKSIGIVKGVWAWGERVELLHRNRVHGFRFKLGKKKRVESPDEYSAEEAAAILAQLSFDRLSQRTPFVVLTICDQQGARGNAVLHLDWQDVDWEADSLTWQAEWDKMGREWAQPMRSHTRAVLGRLWDSFGQPTEGWVFPAKRKDAKSPVYTMQSLWWALTEAEKRAGVEHKPNRATHAYRRRLSGDLAETVGDGEAMRAIGDTDIRQAGRYIKRRKKRVSDALRRLDGTTSEEVA